MGFTAVRSWVTLVTAANLACSTCAVQLMRVKAPLQLLNDTIAFYGFARLMFKLRCCALGAWQSSKVAPLQRAATRCLS